MDENVGQGGWSAEFDDGASMPAAVHLASDSVRYTGAIRCYDMRHVMHKITVSLDDRAMATLEALGRVRLIGPEEVLAQKLSDLLLGSEEINHRLEELAKARQQIQDELAAIRQLADKTTAMRHLADVTKVIMAPATAPDDDAELQARRRARRAILEKSNGIWAGDHAKPGRF